MSEDTLHAVAPTPVAHIPTQTRKEPFAKWTVEAVEELLFIQCNKGEDVTPLLPPSVAVPQVQLEFTENYKSFVKFAKSGPAVLTSHNPNSARQPMTPVKQACNANAAGSPTPTNVATPKSKPPIPKTPKRPQEGTVTPPAKQPRTENTDEPTHSATPGKTAKWPAGIPTDAQIKACERREAIAKGEKRVIAQSQVDPDLIFVQPRGEFPLRQMFAKYPKQLTKIDAARGMSGDWQNDNFTAEEEAQYKRDMHFNVVGPTQCAPQGALALF